MQSTRRPRQKPRDNGLKIPMNNIENETRPVNNFIIYHNCSEICREQGCKTYTIVGSNFICNNN